MTLGELLKSKRIESGRSIEQLAASTKIHAKILTALEEDQYSELPARTFTRGFIVNYARSLKLNSDEVLRDYHDFLEEKFSERPNRDQGHQGYAFEGRELEQNRRWLIIGASIAAFFAIAVLLIFKPQNHKHKEKHKDFEEEVAMESDANNEAELAFPPGTTPTASPAANAHAALVTGVVTSGGTSSTTITGTVTANSTSITATGTSVNMAPVAPAPSAIASSSPSPTATPMPSASPAATSVKEDKMNKGDALSNEEAKKKVVIQANADIWVRYQSDDRPVSTLILRKGRFLVIKAKDKLVFETNHPESTLAKTKGGYHPVPGAKVQLDEKSAMKAAEGSPLGGAPLPENVPESPSGSLQ